jgi:hypothetical protein
MRLVPPQEWKFAVSHQLSCSEYPHPNPWSPVTLYRRKGIINSAWHHYTRLRKCGNLPLVARFLSTLITHSNAEQRERNAMLHRKNRLHPMQRNMEESNWPEMHPLGKYMALPYPMNCTTVPTWFVCEIPDKNIGCVFKQMCLQRAMQSTSLSCSCPNYTEEWLLCLCLWWWLQSLEVSLLLFQR